MGTIVVSSYIVTQQIAPKFFQASHRRCSLYFVQVRVQSLGKSPSISSSTVFSVKNELRKAGYGVPVEKLGLGFSRARSVIIRSKKVEDGEQELTKDDRELPGESHLFPLCKGFELNLVEQFRYWIESVHKFQDVISASPVLHMPAAGFL